MKNVILFLLLLILASPAMAGFVKSNPKDTPIVAYDPNAVIVSPSDPNNVRIVVIIEISKQQYRAMEYLDLSLIDVFRYSSFRRVWSTLVTRAKTKWANRFTLQELEAKD